MGTSPVGMSVVAVFEKVNCCAAEVGEGVEVVEAVANSALSLRGGRGAGLAEEIISVVSDGGAGSENPTAVGSPTAVDCRWLSNCCCFSCCACAADACNSRFSDVGVSVEIIVVAVVVVTAPLLLPRG